MKFFVVVVAALSATASAIAVASSGNASPNSVKRDAAPAAAPIMVAERAPEAAPVAAADPWCLFHGQSCWKREAAAAAEPEADPWCLFHGQSCWKDKREAAPAPAPAADPEADPWCLFHGQSCWKDKREASPAPAPKAEPEAWCLFHGQSCWKVKRAAYAFANAIRGSAGVKDSRAAQVSNMEGGAAYNAKRAVNDIATMIAGRTSDPPEFIKKLYFLTHFQPDANLTTAEDAIAAEEAAYAAMAAAGTTDTGFDKRAAAEVDERADVETARRWCLFHGQSCWKREAAPWCLFHGQSCWKRAEPMTKREAEADPWCLFHGQSCWKRAPATAPAVEARDVDVDADSAADDFPYEAFFPFAGDAGDVGYPSKRAFAAADKRACNQPGEACDVARRAAEALVSEIEGAGALAARAAEADGQSVEARWCLFHGQSCWKRDNMDDVVARCHAEDGACSQASRDLKAMHNAARSLLTYLNDDKE